jgi:hypothetical protein
MNWNGVACPKAHQRRRRTLRSVSKHLHLAFMDCVTWDEVYDLLVLVFLDVVAHYDPHYTKKTEEVCNHIEKQPAGALTDG